MWAGCSPLTATLTHTHTHTSPHCTTSFACPSAPFCTHCTALLFTAHTPALTPHTSPLYLPSFTPHHTSFPHCTHRTPPSSSTSFACTAPSHAPAHTPQKEKKKKIVDKIKYKCMVKSDTRENSHCCMLFASTLLLFCLLYKKQ